MEVKDIRLTENGREYWIQKWQRNGIEYWDVTEKTDGGIFRKLSTFNTPTETPEEEMERFKKVAESREWTFSRRPYRPGQHCDGTIDSCVHALLMDFCERTGLCDYREIYREAYEEEIDSEELDWTKEFAEWQGVAYPEKWNFEAVNGLIESLEEINNHQLVEVLIEKIAPYYTMERALEEVRDVYYGEADRLKEAVDKVMENLADKESVKEAIPEVDSVYREFYEKYEKEKNVVGERGVVAEFLQNRLADLIYRINRADSVDRMVSILEDFKEELDSGYDELASDQHYLERIAEFSFGTGTEVDNSPSL